jgi:hypothetical protein
VGLRANAELLVRCCVCVRVCVWQLRELRSELLNSERLAARFEDCPRERSLLQHGAPLSKQAAPHHLKHIPGYIQDAVGGDVSPQPLPTCTAELTCRSQGAHTPYGCKKSAG